MSSCRATNAKAESLLDWAARAEKAERERDEAVTRAHIDAGLREASLLERAEKAEAALRECVAALGAIAEEFESTVRHIDSKGKGGQQVPFHGDFASACQLPSFCSRARWWNEFLRAALDAARKVVG